MTSAPAKLLVFVHDRLVCIKIIGRANVGASIDFKRLVSELMEKDLSCFVLDLSDCLLMDSTFLGVLAGFGLRVSAEHNGHSRSIELLNPNLRVTELLENLGVAHLFQASQHRTEEVSTGACEEAVPGVQPTREETTHNCLEAHRVLMEVNPDNAARFKDVTAFLTEDLKKLRAAS